MGMTEPSTHVLSFPEPSSARFELRCWGEFRLLDRLHRAEGLPPRRKARAVIAYLAAHGGASVNRERLAALLWSQRGDQQARASLRQTLLELRPYAMDPSRLLVIERDQVHLNGLALTSDIARIEALARADKLDALAQALAEAGDRLYDGLDGLDPAFDEWLALERRHQQGRLLSLGAAAAGRGLNHGAYEAASHLATELQALDETNEAVAQIGMKADHACGDHSAVRRRYFRLREALEQDLGVAPSQETEALFGDLSGRERPPGSRAAATGESKEPAEVMTQQPQTGGTLEKPPSPAVNIGDAAPSTSSRDDRLRPLARPWARRHVAVLAAVLALVGAAGGAVWLLRDNLPGAAPPAPRLEIVPFVALQSDAASKDFAARLSDQVAGELREDVVGLSLVGPPAAGAKPADLRLSGTATREGGNWRVRESLEDTRQGVALWAKDFVLPADQESILEAQAAGSAGEMVENAVTQLRTKPARRDPRALALFLQSLEAHMNTDINNIGEPRRLLEEAVARAPDYASARGLLALALATESDTPGVSDRRRLVQRAHDEAELAIRTDPAAADGAYAALYFLARARAPDDLAAAEDVLAKGAAKAQQPAFLYALRCRFLAEVGRARAGAPFCQKALALQPLGSFLGPFYAEALFAEGEPELAKLAIDRAVRLHPGHVATRKVQAVMTLFGGRPEEALANLNAHHSEADLERCGCAPFTPQATHALDLLLRARMSGTPQDADKAVAALSAAVQSGQIQPHFLVYGAATVGRPDAAFAMLDQIARLPGPTLQADPSFFFYGAAAPLQRDRRLWPLTAKAGYVKYWRSRGVWPDFCSDPGLPYDCRTEATHVAGITPQKAAP